MSLLESELFVPPPLGKPLGDEILDWSEDHGVDDVAVPEGTSLQQGLEGDQTYYVATED